jgi:hypothetical protein
MAPLIADFLKNVVIEIEPGLFHLARLGTVASKYYGFYGLGKRLFMVAGRRISPGCDLLSPGWGDRR